MNFDPPSPSLDGMGYPPILSPPAGLFPTCIFPPPLPLQVEPSETEIRGRSLSRSPKGSPSPSRSPSPVPIPDDPLNICYFSVPPPHVPYVPYPRARSYSSSRSRSCSPPPRRSPYAPSIRPMSPVIVVPPLPPSVPLFAAPPTPPPVPLPYQTPYQTPPPIRWPTLPAPVDILTFHYGDNMAYAPAALTYEEAIDTALELWPELHAFDRDRISLLVKGPDQLVRVPRMAWNIVLCDLARYEVVRVQVDQLPPPPQYQGDEKGISNKLATAAAAASATESSENNKDDENPKPARRSGGLFSSIRRIFWR